MNIVRRVDNLVKIRHVLVSVSDKTGLDALITGLVDVSPDVHFYGTGGTARALAQILGSDSADRRLTLVADYTGQPETQGGLVKSLDFKIYLSLLTETHNPSHQTDLARTGAVQIDLVVVNLYPFEATTARTEVTIEEARANIDIGGACMIRAAAKNFLRVAVVVDPADYSPLLASLRAQNGCLDLAKRFELTQKAFAHTAAYERSISEYLAREKPAALPSTYSLE